MSDRSRSSATENREPIELNVKVINKDFYTMGEAAAILHVNTSKLYEMSKRETDPFPARILYWKSKGLIVFKEEMNEWVLRNAPLRGELLEYKRKHIRGKK